MDISQESILTTLVEEGGKMRNSEFLGKFKSALNCDDPTEKKQNRELFKILVNNVAVVKEIDDAKCIVLKKKYHHLLKICVEDAQEERDENQPASEEKKGQRLKTDKENVEKSDQDQAEDQFKPDPNEEFADMIPARPPIEQALEQNKSVDLKVKRSLQFVVPLKQSTDEVKKPSLANPAAHKPYALPLRMAPVVITPPSREDKPTVDHLTPVTFSLSSSISPKCKRRASTDSIANVGAGTSPQPRRHFKSAKPADEPRYGDGIPLEASEHELLVTLAAGRWGLVYGLLLNDIQLAEKRDFISGFTALHWAAKCGNTDMVCKIINLSRQNGKGVDVNSKSFAGYTPLHIAAIHNQENVMSFLVRRYGAECGVRDNCGKKAYQYLPKGAPAELLEMLAAPKVMAVQMVQQKDAEDHDAHKHHHTIGRLFQPHPGGLKKKPKNRSSVLSVTEEVREERDERTSTLHRVFSDVFSERQ